MKCFNRFRAKDPVLAAIISMGMIMSAQAIAGAQSSDWEEVGPSALSAQQQLMSAPPRVGANASAQVNYRPPVATPVDNAISGGVQNEYVVQAGDTLPKIAMKVFGDPNRWQDLMVLNNIDNGNRIYVGQKLITVASAETAPVAAHELAEMPEESESADASYYGGSYNNDGTYTIKKGDTLGKIAKELLGSTTKWQKIAKANPSINPNKLKVGDVLVIPGLKSGSDDSSAYNNAQPLGVTQVVERQISAQPWQMASAAPVQPVNNGYGYAPQTPMAPQVAVAPQAVSAPSFDPNTAPLVPPPPPPAGMYGQGFNPPPAPPVYESNQVYSSETMVPPPAPVTTPDIQTSTSCDMSNNCVVSCEPVGVSSRELYREEKYRLPDELKETDYTPYFTNANGYRGLFNTECALIPYLPTWNIGFTFRYDDLKYRGGEKDIIDGHTTQSKLHLNYTGNKFFAGVTVPFQSWEEGINGGKKAELDGLGDTSAKVGYQVWKNLEGTHAVTLHLEGKFAGGNYHKPITVMGVSNGMKTKHDSRIGPAGATNGSWVEMGGAYTGVLNDKWTTHINMAFANNSTDDISKLTLRLGADYRVNRNFSLVGELESNTYEAPTDIYGEKGTNAELTLGFVVYNDAWQCNVGFPIDVKHDWGDQGSFGVIAGISHRWD